MEHPSLLHCFLTGYPAPEYIEWERGNESMGDVAEMVLEGLLCESCGSLIDGEISGFPRFCEDCEE